MRHWPQIIEQTDCTNGPLPLFVIEIYTDMIEETSFLGHYLQDSHARKFCGYPDRHVLRYLIYSKTVPWLSSEQGFLLVNSLAESCEPITRILAHYKRNPQWPHVQDRPLLEPELPPSEPLDLLLPIPTPPLCRSIYEEIQHQLRLLGQNHNRTKYVRYLQLDRQQPRVRISIQDSDCLLLNKNGRLEKYDWNLIGSGPSMQVNPELSPYLDSSPGTMIIHCFPSCSRFGEDQTSTLIIGRLDLLQTIKNLSNMVWYNMDHINRNLLVSKLESTTEKICSISSKHKQYSYEARRMATKIRFDFNETRTQPDVSIQQQVIELLSTWKKSDLVWRAKELLAQQYNCTKPDNILLFRGANHAIKRSVFALATTSTNLLLPSVTYIGHVKAAIGAQCTISYLAPDFPANSAIPIVRFKKLLHEIRRIKPEIILLANPSNPLGQLITDTEFAELVSCVQQNVPASTVIVDAVFHDYGALWRGVTPNYTKYFDEIRLIVFGSLSKEDGFAGARAGFVLGSPNVIRQINRSNTEESTISSLGAATICSARDPKNAAIRIQTMSQLVRENQWLKDKVADVSRTMVNVKGELRIANTFASFSILVCPTDLREPLVSMLKKIWNIDVNYVPVFNETRELALRKPLLDVCGTPIPGLLRISPGTRTENITLSMAIRHFFHSIQN